jgi:23S rRNA pseudouridine2457 synthase
LRHRYIIFNKPFGVLSQFSGERASLADYIPVKGIYPVGRLDRDSEGLLLLTSDGEMQHRLTDPAHGHPRTYWVQVERIPNEDALAHLASGVVIEGQRTRPAQARLIPEPADLPLRNPPVRFRKTVPTAWLELTLTEGRNRQVRKMTASVGHPTLRLIRVAISDLRLERLLPGKWRNLTGDELQHLTAGTEARR